MDIKRQGYAAVWRGILDHYLWTGEPYSRGQAWLELILLANWRDAQKIDRGEVITIGRGQICASDGFWEERWQWSRNKVRAFFKQLEADDMIKRDAGRRRTIITIINYDVYQPFVSLDGTTEGTTESISEGTTEGITERTTDEPTEGITRGITEGTQKNNIKNGKKDKKGNKDDVNNKQEQQHTQAREDELDPDEEDLLIDTFGRVSDYTKDEYIKLEKEYGWKALVPALEKTKLMKGQTIDYTRTLLEEANARNANAGT